MGQFYYPASFEFFEWNDPAYASKRAAICLKTHRHTFLVLLALFSLAALNSVRAEKTNAWFKPPDATLFSAGRYVYQRNCIACHGQWGDGKGEMAPGMIPPPRKFTQAIFKYRSTPPGFLPTDDDLKRTIRNGIPGTSMPTFVQLSDREVHAVTEYIKFFSRKWQQPENYAPPVEVPPLPSWFAQATPPRSKAASGKAHFLKHCASCHGENGDGNGPAAGNLVDNWDKPVKPADLRQNALRAGSRLEDVYRVLLTGVSGTPMPAYGDTLSETERWELVAFIAELRKSNKAQNSAQP